MDISVETYPGHRGMPMPQGFELGARRIEVVDTLDQWFGPDYRYIKVKGDDGDLYILRVHDVHLTWELTMFKRSGSGGVATPPASKQVRFV